MLGITQLKIKTKIMLYKIGMTIAISGLFGVLINMILVPPFNKIIYHIYSTFLCALGCIMAIISIIFK